MKEPRRWMYGEAQLARVFREVGNEPKWVKAILCQCALDPMDVNALCSARLLSRPPLTAMVDLPSTEPNLPFPEHEIRWTGLFSRRHHKRRMRYWTPCRSRTVNEFTALGLALEVGNEAASLMLLKTGEVSLLREACVKRGENQETCNAMGLCVEKGWLKLLNHSLNSMEDETEMGVAAWRYPCCVTCSASYSLLGMAIEMVPHSYSPNMQCQSKKNLRLEILRRVLQFATQSLCGANIVFESPCIVAARVSKKWKQRNLRLNRQDDCSGWCTPLEQACLQNDNDVVQILVEEFGCPLFGVDKMRNLQADKGVAWLQRKQCREAVLESAKILWLGIGIPRDVVKMIMRQYVWKYRYDQLWAFV
jgi:hypothetical protein